MSASLGKELLKTTSVPHSQFRLLIVSLFFRPQLDIRRQSRWLFPRPARYLGLGPR